MIEIVSARRCIECDICVRVCPANVFDARPEAAPVIARQNDCQTCFLCEIYCPTDALYVAPDAEGPTAISEAEIDAKGLFGSYARALGWRRGKPGGTAKTHLSTSCGATMSRQRAGWIRHRTECGGSLHSAAARAGCGLAIRKTMTDAIRQARPLAKKARR